MVKAIAPKAPIGASFMTMPTMPKKTCEICVDERHERPAALAQREQREAEQHREEQHLQDLAFGEGADDGVRDDVQEELDDAMLARPWPRRRRPPAVSSEAGSTFMPAPGCQTLTTTRPMASATVVTTSK